MTSQASDAFPGSRCLLLAVNQWEHTLVVVDPQTKRVVKTFVVGINGHEVAVAENGRLAYVPIYGNAGVGLPGTDGSTIDVIDLKTQMLTRSIDLGRPVRPHLAKFGADGLLYVTAEEADAVFVIDPSAGKVVAEIPTGQPQSHMLVFSPDGRHAYTSNVGAGSVSVVDLITRTLVTVIKVANKIQRISISVDGLRIFTHDQGANRIAIIDTVENKFSGWVEVPDPPYASTSTPDGRWLLVVSARASRMHIVELQSLKVVKSFQLPEGPTQILIPDGKSAYIGCGRAGKIAVLDFDSWQLADPITVTAGVDGLGWVPANSCAAA
jgi:YVTN family beta-propeller protein